MATISHFPRSEAQGERVTRHLPSLEQMRKMIARHLSLHVSPSQPTMPNPQCFFSEQATTGLSQAVT